MSIVYLVVSTHYDEFEILGVYDDSDLAVRAAKSMSREDLVEEQKYIAEVIEEARAAGEESLFHPNDAWNNCNTFHVMKMRLNERLIYSRSMGHGPSFRWGVDTDSDEYRHLKQKYRTG